MDKTMILLGVEDWLPELKEALGMAHGHPHKVQTRDRDNFVVELVTDDPEDCYPVHATIELIDISPRAVCLKVQVVCANQSIRANAMLHTLELDLARYPDAVVCGTLRALTAGIKEKFLDAVEAAEQAAL